MSDTFKNVNPRRLCQGGFLLFTLWIGWRFALWARPLLEGEIPQATRPAAVDAFLPLSGLLNLKYALISGTIHEAHPAALLIFLAVCASALLVKKGFCSFVCPVGFAGEMVGKLGEKVGLSRRLTRVLDLPLRSIKYLLLAFFLWNIVLKMPGFAVGKFLSSGYNLTADIRMFLFFITPSKGALLTFAALFVLPFFIKGGWCRYFCPYGALLGLLSVLSPFKIHRNETACTACGKCRKVCPSSISVDKKHAIFSDECTGCLTCVSACPSPEALRLSTSSKGPKLKMGIVALLMVLLFVFTSMAGRLSGNWESQIRPRSLIMQVMMKMEKKGMTSAGGRS